jgi:hypothetical protein
MPVAIACDASGNVYEGSFDFDDYYIKKITTDGKSTNYAGNGSPGTTDGPLLSAEITVTQMGIDQTGNLYVMQPNPLGDILRKITATEVTTVKLSRDNVLYPSPSGLYPGGQIAIDTHGNVYLADYFGNSIKKISSDGVVSTLAGVGGDGHVDGPGSAAQFSTPTGITIDVAGNLYVTEAGNNNDVRKIVLK